MRTTLRSWSQMILDNETWQVIKQLKPGALLEFGSMTLVRQYRVVRRDFKRKKVWLDELQVRYLNDE